MNMGFTKVRVLSVAFLMTILAASAAAADGSVLKPPAGASVAIIVFEDLECPACARAAPLLAKAAEVYQVPLVVHDVPNPGHPWAYEATVTARYIEQKYGRGVSDPFRAYIFQNQPQITKANFRSFADRFALAHKIDLPMMMDPQGQIANGINKEIDLARQAKLEVTPTIFVVATNQWQEVKEKDQSQLYAVIDKIKRAVPAPAAAKSKAKKK
jgi:protein-disulfide isomerase